MTPPWLVLPLLLLQSPQAVRVTPRQIPVAAHVDLVILGGGFGAVAAAVSAAEGGARVFLAARRPYLGGQLCAAGLVGPAPEGAGADPLARRLFLAGPKLTPAPEVIPFTYHADLPSRGVHRDRTPPSLLGDGRWGGASRQSVQYDDDVTLLLDLGKERDVSEIRLKVYHRPGDFEVASFAVSAGPDGRRWEVVGRTKPWILPDEPHEGEALTRALPCRIRARFLRLQVRKSPRAGRLLLGEILLVAPGPAIVPPRAFAPSPQHLKRTLDQALLAARVPFLYGSFPTDLLHDDRGRPAGVVLANRAGRQAVVAKVMVDATEGAWLCRRGGGHSGRPPRPSGPAPAPSWGDGPAGGPASCPGGPWPCPPTRRGRGGDRT